MAKKCVICGKKYQVVWRRIKLRGKYNPTIKRKQKPNLQWVKLASGSQRDKSLLQPPSFRVAKAKVEKRTQFSLTSLRSGKRVLACAKCVKAMGKRRR